MKKLMSIGSFAFSLAVVAAFVWGSSAVAVSEGTPESVASTPRAPIAANDRDAGDDEDGGDDDGLDTPETDYDGIDTPPTDNDGVDTPTPTDNDGIDAPYTDYDGTDIRPTTMASTPLHLQTMTGSTPLSRTTMA